MPARNFEPAKHKFNLCLIILAVIFLSVAVAINWWTRGYGDSATYFTLWEAVVCNDNVCLISDTNSAGWLLFVRLMMGVCFGCFAGTICAQIIYIFKPRNGLRISVMVFSGLAGGILTVTGFTIAVIFLGISRRYNTATQRLDLDPNALRYQTLPLGFIFLAAFISSIVGVFTLVNIEPKARNRGDFHLMLAARQNSRNRQNVDTKL